MMPLTTAETDNIGIFTYDYYQAKEAVIFN